jgi:Tfp pilus assembly protein PilV
MTTVLLGVAVTSVMALTGASTRANDAAAKLTQAVLLAQEIREWTLSLPFSDPNPGDAANPPGHDGSSPQIFVDDVDDLMDVTYSPPRDGQGQPMDHLQGWSQTIELTWVDPETLAPVGVGATETIRVHVRISYCNGEVFSTAWLVTRRREQ